MGCQRASTPENPRRNEDSGGSKDSPASYSVSRRTDDRRHASDRETYHRPKRELTNILSNMGNVFRFPPSSHPRDTSSIGPKISLPIPDYSVFIRL